LSTPQEDSWHLFELEVDSNPAATVGLKGQLKYLMAMGMKPTTYRLVAVLQLSALPWRQSSEPNRRRERKKERKKDTNSEIYEPGKTKTL
jgi:hypothetical protein